jgi:ATP-dependent exoDNAse (exonuclease V) alpha subunit
VTSEKNYEQYDRSYNFKWKGEDVPTEMPFEFKRWQFPVRLAFAMNIKKAQGQSLQVCELNLENPCFSHGQLYVACSRVGKAYDLFVYTPEGKTKNIVYSKALQNKHNKTKERLSFKLNWRRSKARRVQLVGNKNNMNPYHIRTGGNPGGREQGRTGHITRWENPTGTL